MGLFVRIETATKVFSYQILTFYSIISHYPALPSYVLSVSALILIQPHLPLPCLLACITTLKLRPVPECLPVSVCQIVCQCLCARVLASACVPECLRVFSARVPASVCVPECLPVFVCKRQGVQGGATPLARYA